jgi:NAD(P)-dependent dehydrogenase (short-subunit alcohol dehydrogenase family)
MDLGLQGRVALITGGSKGIGQAAALGLAREGADVAICARGQELLERVAAETAQQTGRRVLPVVADMNREEDAQRFIQTVVQHFGRLDILVNCAGSSPGGTLKNLTEHDWMVSLNLKFMGYVRTVKWAIPYMQERRWGRIINVIGNDGIKPI